MTTLVPAIDSHWSALISTPVDSKERQLGKAIPGPLIGRSPNFEHAGYHPIGAAEHHPIRYVLARHSSATVDGKTLGEISHYSVSRLQR